MTLLRAHKHVHNAILSVNHFSCNHILQILEENYFTMNTIINMFSKIIMKNVRVESSLQKFPNVSNCKTAGFLNELN